MVHRCCARHRHVMQDGHGFVCGGRRWHLVLVVVVLIIRVGLPLEHILDQLLVRDLRGGGRGGHDGVLPASFWHCLRAVHTGKQPASPRRRHCHQSRASAPPLRPGPSSHREAAVRAAAATTVSWGAGSAWATTCACAAGGGTLPTGACNRGTPHFCAGELAVSIHIQRAEYLLQLLQFLLELLGLLRVAGAGAFSRLLALAGCCPPRRPAQPTSFSCITSANSSNSIVPFPFVSILCWEAAHTREPPRPPLARLQTRRVCVAWAGSSSKAPQTARTASSAVRLLPSSRARPWLAALARARWCRCCRCLQRERRGRGWTRGVGGGGATRRCRCAGRAPPNPPGKQRFCVRGHLQRAIDRARGHACPALLQQSRAPAPPPLTISIKEVKRGLQALLRAARRAERAAPHRARRPKAAAPGARSVEHTAVSSRKAAWWVRSSRARERN